jgi:phosphatidylglycerophosphate synthase
VTRLLGHDQELIEGRALAGLVALPLDLFGLPLYFLGKWLTVGAAILTLWSMFVYLRAALPYLRERAQ